MYKRQVLNYAQTLERYQQHFYCHEINCQDYKHNEKQLLVELFGYQQQAGLLETMNQGIICLNQIDSFPIQGKEMLDVYKRQRLGIIIDVSHLSDAGFYDVLENTSKPFVASHSNARSVCPHARNMSDDMILKLASRKGVMGINFAGGFLGESEEENALSRISAMVKHILYIKDLAGIDCIGLGLSLIHI